MVNKEVVCFFAGIACGFREFHQFRYEDGKLHKDFIGVGIVTLGTMLYVSLRFGGLAPALSGGLGIMTGLTCAFFADRILPQKDYSHSPPLIAGFGR